MSAKFELKKAHGGKFMFHLKAGNSETILTSELCESKAGAETGIALVKQNAPLDERYERKMTSAGRPYFVLHAANQEIIGQSETYTSRGTMEKGIASVKRNAAEAGVDDKTVAETQRSRAVGKS